MVNGTDSAWVGEVYSRSPANIATARGQLEVGMLFINRSSTPALVDIHPMHGSKLSATGPQLGGLEYLLAHLRARTICEHTVRHGFAPTEDELAVEESVQPTHS